jgi:hypothetical protein
MVWHRKQTKTTGRCFFRFTPGLNLRYINSMLEKPITPYRKLWIGPEAKEVGKSLRMH